MEREKLITMLAAEVAQAYKRATTIDTEYLSVAPLTALSMLDAQFTAAAEHEVKATVLTMLTMTEPVALTGHQVYVECVRRLTNITLDLGVSRNTASLKNLADDARAKAWGRMVERLNEA